MFRVSVSNASKRRVPAIAQPSTTSQLLVAKVVVVIFGFKVGAQMMRSGWPARQSVAVVSRSAKAARNVMIKFRAYQKPLRPSRKNIKEHGCRRVERRAPTASKMGRVPREYVVRE